MEEQNREFSDRLDIIKHLLNVHSRIRGKDGEEINDDFTMAFCKDAKDKEGVIASVDDAMFSLRLLERVRNMRKWYWSKKDNDWVERELEEKEKKEVERLQVRCYDTFMTRPYMTVIMNRNISGNPMIGGIIEVEKQEQEEEPKKESENGIIQRAMKVFKGKKKKEVSG